MHPGRPQEAEEDGAMRAKEYSPGEAAAKRATGYVTETGSTDGEPREEEPG